MADRTDRKLFLGPRLRRLRRELDVSQARMAADIGISPSYLNLLERNQRPVTAQVLLRLAETYELDLGSLFSDTEAAGAASLQEVFADALFKDLQLSRHEVSELGETAPGVAAAVARLYQAYLDGRRLQAHGVQGGAGESAAAITSADWVRDHVQERHNSFPELDALGEAIAADLSPDAAPDDASPALRRRLKDRHGVRVQLAPAEMMQGTLRRYDHHRRRLFLSELLAAPGRAFNCAYQVGLLEGGEVLAALTERAEAPDAATRALLRIALANTLAGAILMPYALFHRAAERGQYDVERLKRLFGVSYEQACHRLTTLSRQGARGVPFFMVRIDRAGNVSKRFAATPGFPFARFGGACPRWNLHGAFKAPGRILTQVVETPDGRRWFTWSRTVRRAAALAASEDDDLALALGCELRHAKRLAYAEGLDLGAVRPTPIGPACRICERPDCPQRAAQPLGRALVVDDNKKPISPYPFAGG